MNVATLSFEITSHSHSLTPNTSSGMVIFKSFFTGTWQDNLQPSFFSFELKCDSSVGSMDPPPSEI